MRKQILFVEDDADDTLLIKLAVKRAGLEEAGDFAANGKAALEYLTNLANGDEPPKLIFLDLNMPVMNGLAFLAWLRQQPVLQAIPVAILTTSENPTDLDAAYKTGANAFLVKPGTMPELIELITCTASFWLKHNRIPRR